MQRRDFTTFLGSIAATRVFPARAQQGGHVRRNERRPAGSAQRAGPVCGGFNRRTARALDLNIPATLLARADEVIE